MLLLPWLGQSHLPSCGSVHDKRSLLVCPEADLSQVSSLNLNILSYLAFLGKGEWAAHQHFPIIYLSVDCFVTPNPVTCGCC